MSLERAPLEQANTAAIPAWYEPLSMLIAWLAHLFEQINKLTRIRRTTTFKPNWRGHRPKLRQCAWHREQVLAAGAAQLLADKALILDGFALIIDPPEHYGGQCPRTPFEMNRRILAIARFNPDPEAAIHAHAARIAKRMGLDLTCPFRLASQATAPGFAGGGLPLAASTESSLAVRRGVARRLRRETVGAVRVRADRPFKTPKPPPAHLAGPTCQNARARLLPT